MLPKIRFLPNPGLKPGVRQEYDSLHFKALLTPNGQHMFGVVAIKRHNRGFVDYDFIVMYDQRIRCAKIDSNILCEEVEKSHCKSKES